MPALDIRCEWEQRYQDAATRYYFGRGRTFEDRWRYTVASLDHETTTWRKMTEWLCGRSALCQGFRALYLGFQETYVARSQWTLPAAAWFVQARDLLATAAHETQYVVKGLDWLESSDSRWPQLYGACVAQWSTEVSRHCQVTPEHYGINIPLALDRIGQRC